MLVILFVNGQHEHVEYHNAVNRTSLVTYCMFTNSVAPLCCLILKGMSKTYKQRFINIITGYLFGHQTIDQRQSEKLYNISCRCLRQYKQTVFLTI